MPRIYPPVKRIIDFLVSAAGLVLLSPLFLIMAIAIKLDSPGPIIFSQERLTKGGKVFIAHKFRSMVVGARKKQLQGTPTEKLITKVGGFLRRTHLDEYPQLINVIKGEMSLVGPRPLMAETEILKLERDKERAKRYNVKAGMAGLERIIALAPERKAKILAKLPRAKHLMQETSPLIFDFCYAENYSFKMDLILFFETFFMSLRKILLKNSGNAKAPCFSKEIQ